MRVCRFIYDRLLRQLADSAVVVELTGELSNQLVKDLLTFADL